MLYFLSFRPTFLPLGATLGATFRPTPGKAFGIGYVFVNNVDLAEKQRAQCRPQIKLFVTLEVNIQCVKGDKHAN